MKKQEFLDKLRLALYGRVAADVMSENLDYYEEYINIQIRQGKSEEEVMAALGDPRLIAKTIIETSSPEQGASGEYRGRAGQGDSGAYRDGAQGEGQPPDIILRWIWLAVAVAMFILIVGVIFKILSLMLPILLLMLCISWLVKFFRDHME